MRKINTRTHLRTKHLFDVKIDTNKLYFEAVEQDEDGNYILHKSFTINQGSGYGEESEYYLLTQDEYEQYRRSYGGGGKKKK